MTKLVIDAYAWMEYLAGSSEGNIVKAKIDDRNNEIYTLSITIAEVISKIKRQEKDYEIAYKAITSSSKVVSPDEEMSKLAGLIHAQIRKKIPNFSLGDSYILQLARSIKAKILTGDNHFKNFDEAIMIR